MLKVKKYFISSNAMGTSSNVSLLILILEKGSCPDFTEAFKYGNGSLTFIGSKLWKMLPDKIKSVDSVSGLVSSKIVLKNGRDANLIA